MKPAQRPWINFGPPATLRTKAAWGQHVKSQPTARAFLQACVLPLPLLPRLPEFLATKRETTLPHFPSQGHLPARTKAFARVASPALWPRWRMRFISTRAVDHVLTDGGDGQGRNALQVYDVMLTKIPPDKRNYDCA